MKVDLSGKIALVTGAAQGVGAQIASQAAESGVEALFLTDRNASLLAEIGRALSSPGREVGIFAADLTEPDAPASTIQAALRRFGRIDCLVNAAGLTDRASFLDGTLATWDMLFAVNARAPFFLMQGAIADFRRRRAPGAIVNIISMNAHCGAPELAIYSSTKGALATLTKNAANAHLAQRIRVNGINMGWCATPGEETMQARTLAKGAKWTGEAAAALPLGRLLDVEEVARLTVFLLSDSAGLMTGTLIDLEQQVTGAPPGWS